MPKEAEIFHEKEKPYVGIISEGDKPKYIVQMNFNYEGYFCDVAHLNENLDTKLLDAYVWIDRNLFLKNVHKRYFDGPEISMDSYLYETDGRYRKSSSNKAGVMEVAETGQCDVSSHFRDMIQFGNYDSILPEEAKRGLQEG
ncbi:hypothetical protein [Mechercharimyces sp. CAU 1602]|uniref:hypothetical protein n=1 Tax=Mechercharimyces sp. CAU 1602 TaxID=2973933 RepID=UPI002161F29B|nr:hypothetical protein [Mechercharimyces sp. CAU 1602]MCS1350748.1 hypothetical protein [Mechercharimyces sp. CAU 1602]